MNRILHIFGITFLLCLAAGIPLTAQEQPGLPDKVAHAEPLYYDLVRDLGARKGEKEINVGADFKNAGAFKEHALLAEFEFAPVHRLGLEAEADILLFGGPHTAERLPANRLECLRFSAQYSFWVSERYRTTMAVGYTQILKLTDFRSYGKERWVREVISSPFFVAAKRWGTHWHTMIYVSPLVACAGHKGTATEWLMNAALHYTLPHSGHFIGMEVSAESREGTWGVTLRPQVKIRLSHRLAAGLVTGIPLQVPGEGFSSFVRLICEL